MMIRTMVVAALLLFGAAVRAHAVQCEHVTGTIVGEDNRDVGVAGRVTVFMRHDGSLVTDTTTADEAGRFDLPNLPTTPYRMLVWANGYAPKSIDEPLCGSNDVRLARFGILRGRVVDLNEAGAEGARVRARHERDDRGYLPAWITDSLSGQEIRADADGRFVIYNVIPDPDLVVVVQAVHVSGEADVSGRRPRLRSNIERALTTADEEVVLYLQPTGEGR